MLDGDGAALMRMGAQATVGYERPSNLIHVLFDNGMHESTGGQATVSHSVDFCRVAAACGYESTERVSTPDALREVLTDAVDRLRFVHVPTVPGIPGSLPRPTLHPHEVAERLRAFLRNGA